MKKAAEIRNFAIAGHAGSGKTTLAEMLVFKGKGISRRGAVENKNTISDFTPEEQERGGSIYATQMNTSWKDHQFFFADTPGYGEFLGEVTASYAASDAALVIIDAVDGPQVGTARAWKYARLAGKPRAAFVNRLDRDRADFAATLEAMRGNHGKNVIIPLYYPVGSESNFSRVVNVLFDKDIPSEIADQVAECRALWMDVIAETDEELMMRYLDGEELTDEEISQGLVAAVHACKAIPIFVGSVAKDIGIDELMDGIIKVFPAPTDRKDIKDAGGNAITVAEDGTAVGQIFKSLNDSFIGQLAFMRVFSGVFKSDSDVFNVNNQSKERIGQMLFMNGKTSAHCTEAGPGSIVAIAKLKSTKTNHTLSSAAETKPLAAIDFPKPVMSYAVTASKPGEDEKIAGGLAKIAECDPTVTLKRSEESNELLLSGMGDQHLAVVGKKLHEQYKVSAEFAIPKVPYRETITGNGDASYRHKKQTGGSGQFAEVHLRIEPYADGYEFANEVVGGNIPKNFIPAVEKGVMEMLARGPLVGCPVQNVKVTVYDGKYHPVDSNEMAFKIASRTAFKEAMKMAKPVLLEPVMAVKIIIPESYTGDISGDLNHKRGRILGLTSEEGMQVVNAEVPLAEMAKYATEIRSMTGGRGSFEMEFARYEQVPGNVAGDIIAAHQSEAEEE